MEKMTPYGYGFRLYKLKGNFVKWYKKIKNFFYKKTILRLSSDNKQKIRNEALRKRQLHALMGTPLYK